MFKIKPIMGKMFAGIVALLVFAGVVAAQHANAPWGDNNKIQVGIVVQSGNSISAWNATGRANMTGDSIAWATPLGDGTYQVRVDLIPTVVYNYIWFAKIVEEGLAGFTSGYQQAEPIPNYGSDNGTFISLSSFTVNQPTSGSVGYTSIGGDARRLLIMPDVPAGTTVYIFNNFASTPTGVANYYVNIGQNFVELFWQGGLGYWGGGMPALDTLGGRKLLYVSTSVSAGPYTLLANLTGSTTYYRHTGLTPGTSYYYIFVSSDAYRGITNPAAKSLWANLRRLTPAEGTTWNPDEYVHNDKFGKPALPVPVYFKVENIDEEHSKTGSIVYLTPLDVDGRFWPYKMPGVLVVGYVPKS